MIIYGRSDATLNPGGVRIGTGDIYRLLDQIEEIEDSVIVGQDWKNDVRVILFVKLTAGYELTDDLTRKSSRPSGSTPRPGMCHQRFLPYRTSPIP